MTVAEIIKAAFRLVTTERNPTATELSDGMEALNLMLQEWSSVRGGVYQTTRESFTLTASDGEYTIGMGQDFNTVQPFAIERAFVRDNSTDYHLNVISPIDYSKRSLKSTETRPYELYFERGASTGTILLYPVPDSAYSLHLYSIKPLGGYTSVSSALGLPPEYEPAIKFNLAVELAPELGMQLDPIVFARADKTLRNLKRLNSQPVPRADAMPFSPKGIGADIYGDTII